MNIKDLKNLLKGELVTIKKDNAIIGAIQLDLEWNTFLALKYTGENLEGNDDYFSLDCHENLEDAINQVRALYEH